MQSADRNGDGLITRDELAARLAEFGRMRDERGRSGQDRQQDSGKQGRPGSGRNAQASAKKSYRFLTPQERFLKDLPEWFLRKDANQDGQVSMAEYSTVWSNALAEEFMKYDLNNDGIVTPDECRKAEAEKGQ